MTAIHLDENSRTSEDSMAAVPNDIDAATSVSYADIAKVGLVGHTESNKTGNNSNSEPPQFQSSSSSSENNSDLG